MHSPRMPALYAAMMWRSFARLRECLSPALRSFGMVLSMDNQKQIEQAFLGAGWRIFASQPSYPIVGNTGDLSITAHGSCVENGAPYFELVDRRRVVSYWVGEIVAPGRAAELLEENGGPPEEGRGNPYNR